LSQLKFRTFDAAANFNIGRKNKYDSWQFLVVEILIENGYSIYSKRKKNRPKKAKSYTGQKKSIR